MSIYFSALFVLLVAQMATISVLVMPLPYAVRKRLTAAWDALLARSQFRTVAAIVCSLVALLFADSWRRARARASVGAGDSMQALTSRSFNQRNVYISGFILYFAVCIPIVLNVVRRLSKYEGLLRELREQREQRGQRGQPADADADADAAAAAAADVRSLRKQLQAKKVSLKALQSQVDGLHRQFDTENLDTGAAPHKKDQ